MHQSDTSDWIHPEPLAPGARVALISPAGPLRGEDELARAVANVERMGWRPAVGASAMAREGYLAGSDQHRAADFNAALQNRDIDAIWFLRGGYGAMRILEMLDLSALTRRPIPLIGFSDITAVHSAVATQCRLVTYHGPTARGVLTDFSAESLRRALTGHGDPCGSAAGARTIRPGVARGRLRGGNLSLLAALSGTPAAQSFEGAIVLLEDINEAVYRVDRMLRQLLMSGSLRGCAGIAFGHCTSCDEKSDDGVRSLDEVLSEVADILRVPCVAGLPSGHIPDQWTIPLGEIAVLEATEQGTAPSLTIERFKD